MDCPRCHQAMEERHGAFRCAEHGVLVSAAAMADKPGATKRLAKAQQGMPSFPCPECGRTMSLVHPKGHDVELCACGALWLDHGEEALLRQRNGHDSAWWLLVEPFVWLGLLFGAG